MYRLSRRNVLELAINTEMREIIEDMQLSSMNEQQNVSDYIDETKRHIKQKGLYIVKYPKNVDTLLSHVYKNTPDKVGGGLVTLNRMYSGAQIIKIRGITIGDAIELLYDMRYDKNFFGALVKSDGQVYNITHPIIANQLRDYHMHKTINLYIYKVEYQDWFKQEELDLMTDSISDKYMELWAEILANSSDKSTAKINVRNRLIINLDKLAFYSLGTSIVRSDLQASDDIYMMIPQHIMKSGIAYPFFNVSLIRQKKDGMGHEMKGMNLTPMYNANISLSQEEIHKFNNICLGNYTQSSIGNAMVLNYGNLNSPLNIYLMYASDDNNKQFIRTSIVVACELLMNTLQGAKDD